jgi:ankyrin repeat protein
LKESLVYQQEDALFDACNNSDLPLVKTLLKAGVDQNKENSPAINNVFYTPLTTAINKGNCSIVRELLLHNANPNGVVGPHHDYTPLKCAISSSWFAKTTIVDIIKFLVRAGAEDDYHVYTHESYQLALLEIQNEEKEELGFAQLSLNHSLHSLFGSHIQK